MFISLEQVSSPSHMEGNEGALDVTLSGSDVTEGTKWKPLLIHYPQGGAQFAPLSEAKRRKCSRIISAFLPLKQNPV